MVKKSKDQPLYVISVVAEMLSVHPQTLRLYEKEGFICPMRQNNQRKYSDEDIRKLNFIIECTRDLGVNKAGLEIILRMRDTLESLQNEFDEVMDYLEEDRRNYFRERLNRIFQEVQ
ncbi:MAG: MerR family transcriptional regulator [Nitrospirae bacterium]|nr:MerR family transcriptional regulator [Nitrospirota bacterium]